MTKITPHEAFQVITPDAVGETWNGVFHNETCPDLYERLWQCVANYNRIDREDCGPADVVGVNSVAHFWDSFTEVEQTELNRLAVEQDAEWERLTAGVL